MGRAREEVVALAALALVACGPRAPSRAPARAPEPPVDEWTPLTWEERHDLMTWTVLPTMGRLFQRFEGGSAPDLTCRTCHGPDPEAAGYRMPRGLTALDPEHMPSAQSADPREARVATFMVGQVVPEMRELLGAPTLGCFTCHPRSR
jgi:hypothetical protein